MALAISCAIQAASRAQAEVKIDDAGKLGLYGDFRGRLETDWDSRRSDGTTRDDRTRLRIRLRAGLTFKPRDEIEGNGMGLALVKKAVQSQGGAIIVESNAEHRGTTFQFTWPDGAKR